MCEFGKNTLDVDRLYQVCDCGKHIWSKNGQCVMKTKNGRVKITNAQHERMVLVCDSAESGEERAPKPTSARILIICVGLSIVCAAIYLGVPDKQTAYVWAVNKMVEAKVGLVCIVRRLMS